MDTLYTFWDNTTHFKTKSVHFWGAYELSDKLREFVFVRLLNYQRFQKVLSVRFEGRAGMLLIGCHEWGF